MTLARTTYAIRVDGHLDDHWSAWLGTVDLNRHDDATTTLEVVVDDQAQLHGVLAGLRDIGAVITELHTLPSAEACRPLLERRLTTERLTLRPATPDDADRTWPYRRLESVNEWLTGAPADLDSYREVFREPARLATTVVVVVRNDHSEAAVIGDFMLRREDAWAQREVVEHARGAQMELGWVLDPAWTGQGFATEAVRELVRYSFEELGVRRITANCFLDNEASWRLMERIGMRRELHAVRDSLHRSGRWLDTVGYAVLRDEWRSS